MAAIEPVKGSDHLGRYYTNAMVGSLLVHSMALRVRDINDRTECNEQSWPVPLILEGFDLLEGSKHDAPTFPFRSRFQFDREHLWLFMERDWQRLRRLFGDRRLPLYQAASKITPEPWRTRTSNIEESDHEACGFSYRLGVLRKTSAMPLWKTAAQAKALFLPRRRSFRRSNIITWHFVTEILGSGAGAVSVVSKQPDDI